MMLQDATRALRGPMLTFVDDPFVVGDRAALRYEPDALVVISQGRVVSAGDYPSLAHTLPPDVALDHYPDALILPGFIDTHVHYPQMQIMAGYGRQLLEWLDKYAFEAERAFADPDYASEVATLFLSECLRAGTTTAMVYCTVHPQSVDAFFERSEALGTRMIAGKVMMDRHVPQDLRDSPQQSYDQSKVLLQRWHKRGRQLYCITPRFAPSSSDEQMRLAGALWQEFPDAYLQSHVAENTQEVAWVKDLHPHCSSYLDVYDRFGQLGPRSVFGHGIHLSEVELARCHEAGAAIAHCPTSNLFLGSGLFRIEAAKRADRPVRVGLATDIGGGTSFSALRTMSEAYKIAQLNGYSLSAAHAFYLATRGAARALYLEDTIGSIAPGYEADLVVLDLHSTPLIDFRMKHCDDLHDALFVQMMLADERATLATYVAGELRYRRAAHTA